MMKRLLLCPILAVMTLGGCKKTSEPGRTQVEIETSEGDITVELYDETPLHRDNFIRLADERFYDNLLFHRVIPDFMIQGGDPESRDADAGQLLGAGNSGQLIAPEFRYPALFHKRGTLAAAREGDQANPLKQSSGCQFYLVWGKTYTDKELNEIERSRNEQLLQQEVNRLVRENEATFNLFDSNADMTALQDLMDSLRTEGRRNIDQQNGFFSMPDSVRTIYRTLGGTPWLDDNYTVFGEVTRGLEVIEKIQALPTDRNDRPLKDIKIKIRIRR